MSESARTAANKKQRVMAMNIVLLRNDLKHYLPGWYRDQYGIDGLLTMLEQQIGYAVRAEESDATAKV